MYVEKKYETCTSEGCTNPTPDSYMKFDKRRPHLGERPHHYSRCSACTQLLKNYNLTVPERNAMVEEQKHECSLCNRKIYIGSVQKFGANTAVVDHCHTTGKVRGILCSHCNQAMGMLNEDISTLENMIEYLKHYNH